MAKQKTKENLPIMPSADVELLKKIESLKKEKWLYGHFVEGLVSGKWSAPSENELSKLAEEKMFSFEPLTHLTDEQEKMLRSRVIETLMYASGRRKNLEPLLGDIYLIRDKYFNNLFTADTLRRAMEEGKIKEKGSIQKLSLADKINYFFDPDFMREIMFDNGFAISGIATYGNRNITEYAYSKEAMDSLVKKTSGRGDRAAVLDIGSSMGFALRDIKEAYGNKIETHGLSVEEEIAMCPVDEQHYGFAERMPKEFKNKFDLIYSNMAFRYFTFQDIALRNVVKALKPGGIAELCVGWDRGPHGGYGDYFLNTTGKREHIEAMEILIWKTLDKFKDLEEKGLLSLKMSPDFSDFHGGYLKIEKLKDFDI